ncbi:probable low affinity copper uptake protein 2 [Nasonia vitripennis]|uniref:Copper transport protein n=1 Tax=Nasonia vitripennis TaxID=7425 RepID=A0A7M7QSU9_NASVI|nr:probable low affinity copper uptake protein 2 [Nasonia vitripennis]XP_032453338.1 probable low affinity copper uptake protein 2 [Nasonia vitripennis]XP_032453339.1 probable low affinity copper uptake protein 2 [Nasonia vitripennis]
MHMAYWFGTELQNFLFYGYNIVTTWGLLSTCLGLSALAILYEVMKLSQVKLRELAKENNQVPNPVQNTDSSSLISRVSERSAGVINSFKCHIWAKWFIEVFHWSAHVTLGYFLMLTVMTFNGYISIALVLGSGIGYYIFGPILLQSNMRKLQRRRRLVVKCNPECADAIISNERRESTMSIVSEHLETEVNVDVEIHG